jgi:hypothetical protein
MGMFDFLAMMDNYEERKVERYEKGGLIIDTCSVTDSTQPYETGICHPKYNDGEWVIVEQYDTEEDARLGHAKWVKKMTSKRLPKTLNDVSESGIASLCDFGGKDWRIKSAE